MKQQNTSKNDQNPTQLLLDLGPLAAFFATYKLIGLIEATAVLIVATMLSLVYTYSKTKHIPPMPLVTGILVAVFGGLTIYLNDEQFIKIKPTIVNLLFAAILLAGLFFKKSLLKVALGSALELKDEGWQKLSLRWGLFFVFLAGLNECIWRNFSTDFWVNFKVFGMFALTLVFTAAQYSLIKRYMIEKEDESAESPKNGKNT